MDAERGRGKVPGPVEVVIERCAGLAVGKADVTAFVRLPGPRGGRRQQIKTLVMTTGGLLQLRAWLVEQVTVAGMEATGDYWKPGYYRLEDAVEVQLLNAAHMPHVPGAKTDQADAAWYRPAGRARAGAAQLRARRSGGCAT